ncbi:MAG: NAD-dependent epimerase/dehydratase family protein [Thermoplasmatota archaeon]
MRIFVAGASGAVGAPLVRQLVARGHAVVGSHARPESAKVVRAGGGTPIQLDLLDPSAVRKAIGDARPDAIIHEGTALANANFGRAGMDKTFAATNRLRSAATDALLAAAAEFGVRRFVAQSFAPFRYAAVGGPVKTEEDPLFATPPKNAQETFAAMQHLEDATLRAGGVALRYGGFYGAANDGLIGPVRKRQFPIIGDGGGLWSFVHVDDAASATVLAVEQIDQHPATIYNVVDDDPAPQREWLPVLAEALGAKPPRRVPRWLATLFAGSEGVQLFTQCRGASNAKIKRELGWTLRYPTWREGFRAAYRRGGSAQPSSDGNAPRSSDS